jgi:hypothetical protein
MKAPDAEFEKAMREDAAKICTVGPLQYSGFIEGAKWSSAFERKRAEGLVEALKFYANKSNWKSVTIEDTNVGFL